MKILILVLTYLDDSIYTNFYNKQNETWNSLYNDNVSVYFYVGNGNKKEIKEHFIVNDTPESLQNGVYKLINSFEKTLGWDYDYIFHTNSSSYVDKDLLYEWLVDKPRTNFYSGVIGVHEGKMFASGCGFTVSKDIVRLILEHQSDWEAKPYYDATLGTLLKNLNVSIHPAPRFDITDFYTRKIPKDYFHYRCRTTDRNYDLCSFDKIFNLKYPK